MEEGKEFLHAPHAPMMQEIEVKRIGDCKATPYGLANSGAETWLDTPLRAN